MSHIAIQENRKPATTLNAPAPVRCLSEVQQETVSRLAALHGTLIEIQAKLKGHPFGNGEAREMQAGNIPLAEDARSIVIGLQEIASEINQAL